MIPAILLPAGESQSTSEEDVIEPWPERRTLPKSLFDIPVPSFPKGKCRYPRQRLVHLSLGLEVVEEDGALLRLLTPVLDDDARAVDDLAGVALAVEDACRHN